MALGRWIHRIVRGALELKLRGRQYPQDLGAGKAFRNRKMLDQLSCTTELPRGTELEHPP